MLSNSPGIAAGAHARLSDIAPGSSCKPPVAPSWNVVDHACRHCLGRVLQREVHGVAMEVRCAQCGAHADGGPHALCCCGADCGALGYALECFKNPNVTKEVPHEIMVRERAVENMGGNFVPSITMEPAGLCETEPRPPHFTDTPPPVRAQAQSTVKKKQEKASTSTR